MYISEGDRHELKAILTMVICSNLKIIDPQLVEHVKHARDLVTTDEDRARFAEMKARLDESLCECGCRYHSHPYFPHAGRGCLSIGCDCTAYVAAGTKTGGQR